MSNEYAKCKFTAAELNGKTVFVKIPIETGEIYEGEAKFGVKEDKNGLVSIAVVYSWIEQGVPRSAARILGNLVVIPPTAFNNIVKNPSGSKFEYNLIVE